MFEVWLRADASARILMVGALYRWTSPEKVIRICRSSDIIRYRGWSADRKERVFRWCVRVSARLYNNPCLVHATAFYWMDGDSRLLIGLKASESLAEAHAWVETGGQTLSTVSTESYAELFNFGVST